MRPIRIRRGSGAWIALVATLGLVGVACDDVVADHNFQRWCGDTLCEWILTEGSYERTSTWHPGESGVSFLGNPTSIHQDVDLPQSLSECLRFEVVSYVGMGAELRLALDFDIDGSVELERVFEHANWESVVFYVRPPFDPDAAPEDLATFRLYIDKYGDGEAIVARMRVRTVDPDEGCFGPPLDSSAPVVAEGGVP